MNKFYLYILLVSIACITFAITLVLALRKFSKKTFKSRSQYASVLVLVAILFMANSQKELSIGTIVNIIVTDIIIVCPVWLLIWEFRSRLKDIPIPKWLAPVSIPIGLVFFKWLHSFSILIAYNVYFIFSFLFLLMSFMFSQKEIEELNTEQ
jgi:hypothetical protein